LLDLGFFTGQRIQLIEGEILQWASPSNDHCVALALTQEALRQAFGSNYWVRVHGSLDLSRYSVPAPDLAVVPGSPRTHRAKANPTTSLLVVEVCDTTLSMDRNRKASLYAKAGIEDYWILNITQQQLEVYRQPRPDPSRRYGFGYADTTILSAAVTMTPLAAPQAGIAVADLLP
jgi:Uma2 family endonuclease